MKSCKGGVTISFSQWPVRDPEWVTGQGQSTEFTAGAMWQWRGSPWTVRRFFNDFFLSYSKQISHTDMTGLVQSLCAFPKLLLSFGSSPESAEGNKGVVFWACVCPGLWLCCEKDVRIAHVGCTHISPIVRARGNIRIFYNRIYVINVTLHCSKLLRRFSSLGTARYKVYYYFWLQLVSQRAQENWESYTSVLVIFRTVRVPVPQFPCSETEQIIPWGTETTEWKCIRNGCLWWNGGQRVA